MPYEILFCYSECQYHGKWFMFKCQNFDLEMDLSLQNIHIYIYLIKLYRKWKHVVCCPVGI